MDQNYYCNGLWFTTYESARNYADSVLMMTHKYCVVFTKAEKEAIINAIDHEMECGK